MRTSRRTALKAAAAGALVALTGLPEAARAAAAAAPDSAPRLVLVILRGAMDGLAVVPATGDPDFLSARAGLGPSAGDSDVAALSLDATFGLHPLLPELHSLYAAQQLAIVHAVCTPYRARSHFDGQNVLEGGANAPFAVNDGWLNRALLGLQQRERPTAIAIAAAMPLVLRGEAATTSWAPSYLPDPNADLVARVTDLYANDQALARALTDARTAHMHKRDRNDGAQFTQLMRAAARFLLLPDGPRVAVLELSGWDTHAAQAQPAGALGRNLRQLQQGISTLRTELGAAWRSTALIAVSEFGRTVAMNGTTGTDHGTGGAVLLVGGAVRGGRVIGDWPGLAPRNLYEGRDLRATTDLRSVLKGVLHQHLRVPLQHLESVVFPESTRAEPISDLVG